MKYNLLEKNRVKYISLVILNEIIQFQHYFPVKLSGNDVYLEAYLNGLLEKGLLRVDNGNYVPTEAGRKELETLYAKYYDYLKMFDIYCAVDLATGEFALTSVNKITDDEEWDEFLTNPRFSDIRVAVSDFKGLDPLEIVFLSFLNENRFDCLIEGWQYDLTGTPIWAEIQEICNTAISVDYLKEEGVIENVIKQGSEIALGLIKQAEESQPQADDVVAETTWETTEEYVDVVNLPYYGYSYWEPYYDPLYVSPIWLAAAVVLW